MGLDLEPACCAAVLRVIDALDRVAASMIRDEYNERFAFNVEWYDAGAMLCRKYQLFYYPKEKLIEMFDLKNRRTFLKKCEYPSIQLGDLYIGATVSIYSRQLKVVDYADDYTRSKLCTKRQQTLGIVMPDAYAHLGKILDAAASIGLVIGEMRMLKMTREQAEEFYEPLRGNQLFSRAVQFLCSDAVTAIELVGENSVQTWNTLIGPADPAQTKSRTRHTGLPMNRRPNAMSTSSLVRVGNGLR